MNDIVTIPQETALTVFTAPKGLDPYLAKIRAEIDLFTGDISTKKGREEIASMAYKVAKVKSYLESVGKELADAQKEIPKKIDAARKIARDTLDAWKDEVRKPLTEWETTEADRIAKITADITELQTVAQDRTIRPSAVIRDRLAEVQNQSVTELIYAEYFDAAVAAKQAAIDGLTHALAEAEQRERDAAELEELRKAKAEREAKEREEQIAKDAADRARIAAEQHAKKLADEAERKAKAEAAAAEAREHELKAQAERAEREKQEAIDRAAKAEADAKARAEREHAAKIEAEKVEAEKREENKKHRARINNAAMAAFVAGGLSEAMAKLAVELIAKKEIPSVTIGY